MPRKLTKETHRLFRIVDAATTALHPDSVRSFNITLNSDRALVEQWDATPGTTEMQEISVLQGLELRSFQIEGNMEVGEQLGILEVSSRLVCNPAQKQSHSYTHRVQAQLLLH